MLYTMFHLNLFYSSIEENKRSLVIKKCYWPILRLAEEMDVPIGVEISGRSLEVVNTIDPGWVLRFKKLLRSDRCELLGSGSMQIIGPLVPPEVNYHNQRDALEVYRRLLAVRPKIAFVNEQAYSSGLVGHYLRAGYKAIIMEWNNSYRFHPDWNKDWRFYPHYASDQRGKRIAVLWNNAIDFQRFQRYAQQESGLDEYLAFIENALGKKERLFPLYGGDAEIFDFRPGRFSTEPKLAGEGEWKRIVALFEELKKNERLELILPSQALRLLSRPVPAAKKLSLESPEQPIPVKKQEKYNITRWAVSGRNNAMNNARCFALYYNLLHAQALARIEKRRSKIDTAFLSKMWRRLVYLFGSDFRTSITRRRYASFIRALDSAERTVGKAVSARRARPATRDLIIINPHGDIWDREPVEIPLRFRRGKYFNALEVSMNGETIPSQMEGCRYYRDMSIQSATIVIQPKLRPGQRALCTLRETDKTCADPETTEENEFSADNTLLTLIRQKGCAIERLVLKDIFAGSLLGTLHHGYFEDISFGADFYSGHTIISGRFSRQITDLNPANIRVPKICGDFPIRIPILCTVPLEVGSLTKIYYLYHDHPRIDLDYIFSLKRLSNVSFRLGMATITPGSFNAHNLAYVTVNGGAPEEFRVKGKVIKHHEPVSMYVSSNNCLGATEGWISVTDGRKGLAVISHKRHLAPVPMIHYQKVDGKYFFRIYHSIGELDDTTNTLWKGENRVRFSFYGYKDDIQRVRSAASHIQRGLIQR